MRANRENKRIRCLIVEDQRMFLELLVTMLRTSPGLNFDVVATAATVAEGIAACELHHPDVLILDLALPDGSGVSVAERLVAIEPAAIVVVLSAETATFVCPKSFSDNIIAVVEKTQAYETLQVVLSSVVASREQHSDMPSPSMPSPSHGPVRLSHREREILLLVGQGMTSGDIAAQLNISRHTVQSHRKKIAVKLGTKGSELSHAAYRFWQRWQTEANGV